MKKDYEKEKFKNSLKNPFAILAFILILSFFIPLPKEFDLVKIAMAVMVIAYGIKLGAFRKKSKNIQKLQSSKMNKQQFEKVKKELESMENIPVNTGSQK